MDRVVIVGAGPAGMMASISCKETYSNANVLLIDQKQRLGTKLRLTGGGRCNVTANVDIDTVVKNIPKNGRFLYSSLHNFGPQQIIKFFEDHHCPLKEEDHNRIFPKSDRSHDIVSTLHDKMVALGVEIKTNTKITNIDIEEKVLRTEDGIFSFDHLIIASGGKTLPGSGSDGSFYPMIQSLGHTVTELIPAEVPLVSSDEVIQTKALQGLSFQDVTMTIFQKGKRKKTLTHDLLFTHFGLSGPLALRGSFYILNIFDKEKPVSIEIDFLKNQNFNMLETQLQQSKTRKEFFKALPLPKRLLNYIDKQSLSPQEVIKNLKQFSMTIHDVRSFQHAFLTNGGVETKEINPQTLQSKIIPYVSFAGEVMDVNAYTGGFNITAALSSGFTAGKYCLNKRDTS